MKIISFIILFFNLTVLCFSQKTCYLFDNEELFSKIHLEKLHLSDLTIDTSTFYFRFWGKDQIVEIWVDENKKCKGQITNFIYKIPTFKKNLRLIYNQEHIDSAKAVFIYDFIMKSNIIELSNGSQIKEYNGKLNGTSFYLEFSDKNNYSLKSYLPPNEKSKVAEEILITNLINTFSEELYLENKFTDFFNSLKNGSYTKNADLTIKIRKK